MLCAEEQVTLRAGAVDVAAHLAPLDSLGLYLHIPFCAQICPYCPYNKELYHADVAAQYTSAVLREIDQYAAILGTRPITSFYIGGGTPTSMLHNGLGTLLEHIYRRLNMQCAIHLESHPNDLSAANLRTIRDLGVEHLSIGIEALQDRHLHTLCRPYDAATARAAIERAVAAGFTSVNTDLIFALPGQTIEELTDACAELIALGVDQIATYPLFTFPYTKWPDLAQQRHYRPASLLAKRRMLYAIEQLCYAAGYERSSVWAFTRAGVPKYCSVTVPVYLGLGASGSSYLPDIFYLNTFNVAAYIRTINAGRLPIALSLPLTRPMQMAGWLYWRMYETRFNKDDFAERFAADFDEVYGAYIQPLRAIGLIQEEGRAVRLTDPGAYWLHVVQDLFSIDYVSTLWGTSRTEPWPQAITLR
jgi:oxygen-independent coproporphyrinogen-3 oxidase